jgi:cytochrome c oxidase cbb3-type subunit 3
LVQLAFSSEAGVLEKGKVIFTANCAACHGQNGEGLVGPNLTDDYYLHGNKVEDLVRVISKGVPEKGMIPWEASLKPAQIVEVASYIHSLHGTKPANPKEAQGELVAN